MKAMIFAAGLGTRLKPITDSMPKALVPVNGTPLLQHTICKLKSEGFDNIIVNVHHFACQIIDFLKANNNFGINIAISDETEMLLDTGGGIKKAAPFFDNGEPFLVHNVDILSDVNLGDLYQKHVKGKNDATLLTSDRSTSRYLLFNSNERLCGWINTNTNETKSPLHNFNAAEYVPHAFAGVHVISPDMLAEMASFPDKFSIVDFYLSVSDKRQIKAYNKPDLKLIDVGKLDALSKAEEFIASLSK